MFDTSHPFYRPLWRRIALFAVTAGWGAVEFAGGAAGWAVLFWGAAGWIGWALLITYRPEPAASGGDAPDDTADDPGQDRR